MTDINILIQLVLILSATAIGCVLALWLKQPVMIGYLIAGMIVGPFTPGPYANMESFRVFAEVGVALLLFVLGSTLTPSRFAEWLCHINGGTCKLPSLRAGPPLSPVVSV